MTQTWVDPAQWIENMQAADRRVSSWPGPRPLTTEDEEYDLLVGREDDLVSFLDNITFHRLTHLIGVSGVGKSSLLMAGIVPELRRRKYVVATCRDWSNVTGDTIDVFLARQLYGSLPADQRPGFTENPDLFWQLHDLGGKGVIILDQFEEIARHSREKRDELMEFVTQLLIATDIPVVLSYRSEYRDVFMSFDRDMRIDGRHVQNVKAVDPSAGQELIRRPMPPRPAPDGWTWESVITELAADEIYSDWSSAAHADSRERIPVGMLHLQALLYVLSRGAQGAITIKGYTDFKKAAGSKDLSEIMGFALEESAQTRIVLARDAATAAGADPYLVRGVSSSLADIVPHLSSGGFKLERDVQELARILLEKALDDAARFVAERLPVERRGPDEVTRVLDTLVLALMARSAGGPSEQSVLAASRRSVAAAVDGLLSVPLGETVWLSLLTDRDVRDGASVGPLMGLNPVVAVIEQLRRFGWATLWLHQLNLARLDSDGSQRGTLTLVHDGLGDALKRWAKRYDADNRTDVLFALTAPQGEDHEWFHDPSHDLSGTPREPRVHVNLGLKGNAVIGARLAHAVFVNCDFRGTLLLGCQFEGVTFLNCRLDGALFSDCTIHGPSREAPVKDSVDDYSKDAPTYIVAQGEQAAKILGQYGEVEEASQYLLSQQPGEPAIPVADPTLGQRWVPVQSGLMIQGSRLSALTFRGTKFLDDAALSLLRVRGSGLDVAELAEVEGGTQPRVEVSESLIRHAAFTGSGPTRGVEIVATWSVLAQWWIGEGMSGTFKAVDCTVGQMWVETNAGFRASCDDDCLVTGLVGVSTSAQAQSLDLDDAAAGLRLAPPDRAAEFRTAAARTDYRRE